MIDPQATHEWVPFAECAKLLDLAKSTRANGFTCFSNPGIENPPISGFDDSAALQTEDYDEMAASLHGKIYPLGVRPAVRINLFRDSAMR